MAVYRRDLTATIAQRPDWWTPYMPPEWYRDAFCAEVDPAVFFPEKGGSTRPAKKICAACPVIDQCRVYSLTNDEHFGIWAGMTELDRRNLRRERKAS